MKFEIEASAFIWGVLIGAVFVAFITGMKIEAIKADSRARVEIAQIGVRNSFEIPSGPSKKRGH